MNKKNSFLLLLLVLCTSDNRLHAMARVRTGLQPLTRYFNQQTILTNNQINAAQKRLDSLAQQKLAIERKGVNLPETDHEIIAAEKNVQELAKNMLALKGSFWNRCFTVSNAVTNYKPNKNPLLIRISDATKMHRVQAALKQAEIDTGVSAINQSIAVLEQRMPTMLNTMHQLGLTINKDLLLAQKGYFAKRQKIVGSIERITNRLIAARATIDLAERSQSVSPLAARIKAYAHVIAPKTSGKLDQYFFNAYHQKPLTLGRKITHGIKRPFIKPFLPLPPINTMLQKYLEMEIEALHRNIIGIDAVDAHSLNKIRTMAGRALHDTTNNIAPSLFKSNKEIIQAQEAIKRGAPVPQILHDILHAQRIGQLQEVTACINRINNACSRMGGSFHCNLDALNCKIGLQPATYRFPARADQQKIGPDLQKHFGITLSDQEIAQMQQAAGQTPAEFAQTINAVMYSQQVYAARQALYAQALNAARGLQWLANYAFITADTYAKQLSLAVMGLPTALAIAIALSDI